MALLQSVPENSQAQLLFTFEESARLLGGISPWSLRRHAYRNNIRTVHLGQRVFLDVNELDRICREGLPSLSGPKDAKNHIRSEQVIDEVRT